ncbi:carboxylesterase family domain-containing protein [Ditylenchus destructor]|uniref:Carboxylesterase family domain-containing protein n=1 Tax=Ditylenchus destructor TaxID=166010 RepID=A0AAD4NIQ8_9BILA|nr:carboxylesterase family domain-containing protein [Ditylenchus destructor]
MMAWCRCSLPWIMLILMEVALIIGSSASFVDELFASETEVTEVVDVEKSITYKGLSGEVHVQHSDRRAKRDASDNHFYKGSAWVFLNIPYVVPLNDTTVFEYSRILDADAFKEMMIKRHEDEANYRRFGNFCPQVESDLTGYYRDHCFSEMAIDCLNLNVFTPVLNGTKEGTLYPVYVLFHGGKLSHGSSCDFGRQGLIQNFVMQDIIVVTVNYRLGLYGYLKTTENWKSRGLVDQIHALFWVQEHIKAFKGDKNSVTLGGFEAGACSAAVIMQKTEIEPRPFNNVILHGSTALNCMKGGVFHQNIEIDTKPEDIAGNITEHNVLTEKFPLGMQIPVPENQTEQPSGRPLNVLIGLNRDELLALDESVDYYVSNKTDLMEFFTKYLIVDNKTLEKDINHLFKRDKPDVMKFLMNYIFTRNVLLMAKELNDNNHTAFVYRFSHVPDAKLFADVRTGTELLANKVPHGTDFRYAYLPPQYWKDIIAANDSATFHNVKNVSTQWTGILVNLIKGNIKELERDVPRYSGDIETGKFLEFDGSENNVSKKLLSWNEYDTWSFIYDHRNDNYEPAATTACQNCNKPQTEVVSITTKSLFPSAKSTIAPHKRNHAGDGDKTTTNKPGPFSTRKI